VGRDGARLPCDLGETGGEHDGVNCCGVMLKGQIDGWSHDEIKNCFEWGGGRAPG